MKFLRKIFGRNVSNLRVLKEVDGLIYKKNSSRPFSGKIIHDPYNSNLDYGNQGKVGEIEIFSYPYYEHDYEKPGFTSIEYKDGVQDGLIKRYFCNEKKTFLNITNEDPLRETCEMKNGLKHGKRVIYDFFGPDREENYSKGELHGPVYKYRETGDRYLWGNYDKGKLSPYVSYYDNGSVKSKKSWKEDSEPGKLIRTGEWEEYTVNSRWKEDPSVLKRRVTYDKEGRIKKEEVYNTSFGGWYLERVTLWNKGNRTLEEQFWSKGQDRRRTSFDEEGILKDEFWWYDGKEMIIQERVSSEDGKYLVTEFNPWNDKKDTGHSDWTYLRNQGPDTVDWERYSDKVRRGEDTTKKY